MPQTQNLVISSAPSAWDWSTLHSDAMHANYLLHETQTFVVTEDYTRQITSIPTAGRGLLPLFPPRDPCASNGVAWLWLAPRRKLIVFSQPGEVLGLQPHPSPFVHVILLWLVETTHEQRSWCHGHLLVPFCGASL